MSDIEISIIVPVYNRPKEADELLASLCKQTDKDFELLIVEDGSTDKCEEICRKYENELRLKYFYKENTGPGRSRNYGMEKASGNFFIFFDSDCIVPPEYVKIVKAEIKEKKIDAFGGPDMADESFTIIQKAINYSMTSFFTTGGIRGGKKKLEKFHPRSFNMGLSKEVFEKTKGFSKMRFGEDIDLSIRIIENNFNTKLIEKAAVYHKRRTDFRKFFKQVYNSGIARINLYKRHPKSLKIVHFLPAVFLEGSVIFLILAFFSCLFLLPFALFILIIFVDALQKNKNIGVAFYAVIASFIQLYGYGAGFWLAFWRRIILKKGEFKAFSDNFYK